MGIDNGCSGPISLDEITTNNQTLNAPTLTNPSVTGNITLDATATAALCTALTPCIEGSIPTTTTPSGPASGDLSGTYPNPTINPTAITTVLTSNTTAQDAVASVFKNCTGSPRAKGDHLVDCAELNAVIDAVYDSIDSISTTPSGPASGDLAGTYPNPTLNPAAIASLVENNAPIQNAVASVFRDCTGSDLQPRASLITCSDKGVTIPYLVNGVIPATQLPAYVDEVMEFLTLAGFPVTGEAGKIYIDASTGKTYRWNGTGYTEISASAGLTVQDEGSVLTTAATSLNFVGTALQATNTGGSVTVTQLDATESQRGVVEFATPAETLAGTSSALAVTPSGLNSVLYQTSSEGITPPTLPPSAGSSLWYTDTTLNETWAWTGTAWALVRGKALDVIAFTLTNASPNNNVYGLHSYTIPRSGLYSLSAGVTFVQRGVLTANTYIDFAARLLRNGSSMAAANRMMSNTATGASGAISISHAVGAFSAGDVIDLRVLANSNAGGMLYDVVGSSFQCLAV